MPQSRSDSAAASRSSRIGTEDKKRLAPRLSRRSAPAGGLCVMQKKMTPVRARGTTQEKLQKSGNVQKMRAALKARVRGGEAARARLCAAGAKKNL